MSNKYLPLNDEPFRRVKISVRAFGIAKVVIVRHV